MERLDEAGAKGKNGNKEEIGNQRPLSAKPVGKETENNL